MTHVINSRSRTHKTRGVASKSKPERKGAQIPSSKARRAPTQSRAQDTANAVITAAEQLLVEVGYARASTNAIARRAGVSVGSLYQYYPNKEAVFRAVVFRHSAEVKPEIHRTLETLRDPKSNLVDCTLHLLRKLAEINAENPRLQLAIDRELGFIGHDHEASVNAEEPIRAILAQRFALPRSELDVIVALMVQTVTHLSRWLVHSKPPELDFERFLAATGRMLNAILPEAHARDMDDRPPSEERLAQQQSQRRGPSTPARLETGERRHARTPSLAPRDTEN